ncbi:MAG: DUF3857 domain-containing protein, partial [Acidobacteria bacterium]|nr:DUF3857 domain-containing protein [Acidobacteriota bacterium]
FLRLAALAFALSGSGILYAGAAEHHRFAAPAAWVSPMEPDYGAKPPAGAVSASDLILLIDRQIDIDEAGAAHYRHVAAKVLDAAGVDSWSQLDLTVDPSFETLVIHRLRIVRDGRVLDQTRLARITELPQETELPGRVYNGRYNINILLSDVRAGDVVEYSCTLRSREPMFPGYYFARIDMGWSAPVRRQRIRARAPVTRRIVWRTSDGSAVPVPAAADGKQEFVAEWQDLAAVPALDSTPGWHATWPYVEIGDHHSWSDVARTVEPLYRLPAKPGPRLAEALDTIRGAGGEPADRALRALQFAQEEVRYTSIAIGRGSWTPASAELVLERRFGDCKDKSLLLTALLDGLGVASQVALVHSSRGRALDDSLPSPYAFDHAIVRAVIDGQVYWLDPTAATQYAPLSATRHPDFERALPVGPASPGLEVIPAPGSDTRRKEITTTIDLSAGIKAPGTMKVTTLFKGELADEMRPSFAGSTAEQMKVDYEAYTGRYYPGARAVAPVEVDDDRTKDVLTVRESYRLESAFAPNEDGLLEFPLHADELYPYTGPLGAAARQAPLALEYPIGVRQRLIVKLPEDWPVTNDATSVDNPAFRYSGRVEYADRRLTLDYEYEALAGHVAPQDLAKFEADRARVHDDLGLVLNHRGNPLTSGRGLAVAPVPMLGLVFVLAFSFWAAIRWGNRYDPPSRPAEDNAPAGLRGWLVLPALSSIVSPLAAAWIAVTWLPYIEADLWSELPTLVSDAYAGAAQPVTFAILAVTALEIVAWTLTGVLFFRKRTSAPLFFVAVSWFSFLSGIGVGYWKVASGLFADQNYASLGMEFSRGLVITGIWTAYWLTSKRVKATFVRRRFPEQPSLPASEPEASNL